MELVYYEFSHGVLLKIGTCYIYLIAFTLSHWWTWNSIKIDTTYNSNIIWHTDRNSQTSPVLIYNSQIVRLATYRRSLRWLANPKLTFRITSISVVCPKWYGDCWLVQVDSTSVDPVYILILAKYQFVS